MAGLLLGCESDSTSGVRLDFERASSAVERPDHHWPSMLARDLMDEEAYFGERPWHGAPKRLASGSMGSLSRMTGSGSGHDGAIADRHE